MKPETKEDLKKKGWKEEDIERAESLIESGKLYDKSRSLPRINRMLFSFAIVILLICNLLVSLFLIPFLFVLKGTFLYLIVGTLGFVFGLLFNFLIRDLEHLELKHHLFAAIFIPIVAVVNIFVMVSASLAVSEIIAIPIEEHPIIMSSVYVVAFLGPYIYAAIVKQ